MTEKVKVAGIQIASVGEVSDNLRKAFETAELAVENGAKIICFPELFSTPWFPTKIDKSAFELAQPLSGETITQARKNARKWKTTLVVPFFEDSEKGVYYNSAAVINPDGDVQGMYRKIHVPQVPGWEEKSYFTPGNMGFPIFSAMGVKFGIQICWDNFFPEGARLLALAGARLVFAPTANTGANDDLWQQSMCNNAFVNGMFYVRVNRVGEQGEPDFSGASFCASPTGDLLEDPMGEVEGVGLWPIDPSAVDFVRREWPFLRDRRPRQYLGLAGLKIVRDAEKK